MIYDLKSGFERQQLLQQCGVVPLNLVVPLSQPGDRDGEGKVVEKTFGNFKISLDVGSFGIDELSVKVRGHDIVVSGEQREGEIEFIARQFTRRYRLPDDFDPRTVSTQLANDGKLTIAAERKTTTDSGGDRFIPIQHRASSPPPADELS
jgi:hypothetical protein